MLCGMERWKAKDCEAIASFFRGGSEAIFGAVDQALDVRAMLYEDQHDDQ